MEWKEALRQAKHILCLSHPRPDGDAVGSLLGIYHTLESAGKKVVPVLPDPVPEYLRFLPGWEHIRIAHTDAEAIQQAAQAADLFFCVDFGRWDRIPDFLRNLIDPTRLIWVDHHADSEPLSQLGNFWNAQAAATCEILYEQVLEPLYPVPLPARIALYTGLLTDTGGFRFRSVSPTTLQVAARLITPPFPLEAVHHHIFYRKKLHIVRLYSHILENYVIRIDELPVLLMYIPMSLLEQFGARWEETEGFANQLLTLEGVLLSIVLKEYPESIRVSLRSVGDFPCHELAQQFDKGGGHRNAAGATLYRSLEEALDFTQKLIREQYAETILEHYRRFLAGLELYQLQE
ncbi:MAG: DHH family phosphoesterase [Bacteroidia bacterium]|nr:DHH family phosphoesterase [Bacteroidia bacterium]MDW8235798.1 DHH family phosphoesterase [Bacteroidia bacterium]